MKKKFKDVTVKALPYVTGVSLGLLNASTTVLAANNTANMMDTVGKLAAMVAGVLGVLFGVFGFVSLMAAQAEGDGPAKHKSQMQLAAAVGLIALSALLAAKAKTMASWIPKI